MYSTVEIFNKTKAIEVLTTANGHNRPLSAERVRTYAREMRDGRWLMNPQGISFGVDGQLQNGQHTLSAIVAADVSLPLYVHRDCPMSSSRAYDQGLARTAAQIFAQESGANGGRYAAASRAVLEHGLGVVKPTNQAIVEWAQDHRAVLDRYMEIGRHFTAGAHAGFVFADLQGFAHVQDAAHRLAALKWGEDYDDPMRALALAFRGLGTRDGAKGKQVRFFTTLGALQSVSQGLPLRIAKKYESMPPKVRESVRPGVAA